ncbi:class I SAM-dependent methyltransferase [Aneurinibacillus aneurinilyticus]|jgi:phospholipid N-methyltransferase|uniref:Methyltransferase domain-containing protein n=2 Tax=Aneurinibacillus aneurinilyticus TaxID=1391 RepID=A0A848D1A9_ANEAE|nr:methyltransferase domain-containing protein [Aneurinibacillus aneurinilyticus]ERI08876.1 methyltransferase domain protein [Aneurinibacillus aneurinilyticus ATCC 12856]MCI1694797.1 methyltransferase domain-containing protein [Aneurinibacillus aneurinilyticus]MED0672945.1 methyltransferase domain-containing protein [Aneurinibacillus aneurinilyticus]MED0709245.1 methyltransferase domain-containing protein [Aneurinibacillus aneurinilyticus]MED0726200.1 methyltransferase domain-containing protei
MEKLMFLTKFLRSPRNIGSVTPSSRFLAKAMVKPVDWNSAKHIAELGAGTGVFTKQIDRLRLPDCKVVVFEQDRNMRKRLEHLYPGLYYHHDACDISSAMKQYGINQFDYILSGLPFTNFSQKLRDEIMDEVERALKPGGTFVAFQFSLQMKKQLAERFGDISLEFVPMNVLPAFVYCCRKIK